MQGFKSVLNGSLRTDAHRAKPLPLKHHALSKYDALHLFYLNLCNEPIC